eukprot:gb/GEZN01018803.1/.p1 GENE.gb/GEZN01018803.1/~~gb/GEZN01018803.1/.p1  ORF type:complete len:156 (-),score=11.06 gb/GEZN01018803.1/:114-581(-)
MRDTVKPVRPMVDRRFPRPAFRPNIHSFVLIRWNDKGRRPIAGNEGTLPNGCPGDWWRLIMLRNGGVGLEGNVLFDPEGGCDQEKSFHAYSYEWYGGEHHNDRVRYLFRPSPWNSPVSGPWHCKYVPPFFNPDDIIFSLKLQEMEEVKSVGPDRV